MDINNNQLIACVVIGVFYLLPLIISFIYNFLDLREIYLEDLRVYKFCREKHYWRYSLNLNKIIIAVLTTFLPIANLFPAVICLVIFSEKIDKCLKRISISLLIFKWFKVE